MPLLKPRTLTPARLLANRRSARKSTGPRTAAGKKWSRLNALRNGRRSPAYGKLYFPLTLAPLGKARETAACILSPEELAHPFFANVVDSACRVEQFQLDLAFRKLKREFFKSRMKPKSALK